MSTTGGFFKPVNADSRESVKREFEKMDRYFSITQKPGLMLAQVRKVVDCDGKALNEYHLSVTFVEYDDAVKVMQIFGKELISDADAAKRHRD